MSNNEGGLSKINLPSFILGPAGDAISRVIGIPFEMLRARLERPLKAIEARTEAQKAFQIELAKTLAKDMAANPEVSERALEAFARDLYTKQSNREAVAQGAIEALADSENQKTTHEDSPTVSDDWLNFFASYAEKASSESMRKLWSSILAGEIRKPGAYSLATMRVLAEIDSSTAKCFESLAPLVVNGNWIPLGNDALNRHYNSLVLLSERGLLRPYSMMERVNLNVNDQGVHITIFPGEERGLLVRAPATSTVPMSGVGLQAVGRELMTLLKIVPAAELVAQSLDAMEKATVTSVHEVALTLNGEHLRYTLLREVWRK